MHGDPVNPIFALLVVIVPRFSVTPPIELLPFPVVIVDTPVKALPASVTPPIELLPLPACIVVTFEIARLSRTTPPIELLPPALVVMFELRSVTPPTSHCPVPVVIAPVVRML